MEPSLTAIEVTGIVNDDHQLQLDAPLPISGPKRVRVIVLYSENDEWDENDWIRAAASNPAFADLNDPAEDIYSLADGRPFDTEA
jgi:hypothetical protein